MSLGLIFVIILFIFPLGGFSGRFVGIRVRPERRVDWREARAAVDLVKVLEDSEAKQ